VNQIIENINNRRSVRYYEDRSLSNEMIDQIIAAGNMAPSGANGQPWRFVIITDKDYRRKLAELALPRYQAWLEKSSPIMKEVRKQIDAVSADPVYYSAPMIVFVIGQGNTADLDCAMACENMMLAARSLGLGSCWVYFGQLILDVAEVRQMLELKEGEKVYGPLVFGYPKGDFPPSPPKKPPVIKVI